jgi:hypothetical protein
MKIRKNKNLKAKMKMNNKKAVVRYQVTGTIGKILNILKSKGRH